MTKEEQDELLRQGYAEVYGVWWPPVGNRSPNPAMIEREMFNGDNGEHSAKGFLGQVEHFKKFMELIFSHDQCLQKFIFHPNAEVILRDYFENQWVSIVGHGSSGKSRCIAAIAVAEFLMRPESTACLVTSTTVDEGKKRVWADVSTCWNDACAYFGGESNMPGELVPSIAVIRFINRAAGTTSANRGISLIPSNEQEAKVGLSRMVGYKSPRLRIFLDEASHISYKIVEAAETNLITGAFVNPLTGLQDFKVAATLNPNTRSDTGGRLCEPKDGWKSVKTSEASSWQGKRGLVRRFSAEKSPNVAMAREGKCQPWEQPYPGLLSLALLDSQRDYLGAGSTAFQLQYLACWPETEAVETIYSLDELKRVGAGEKVNRREMVSKVYGFDPSFTHDGDRCPLVICDLFRDETGKLRLEYAKTIEVDDGMDPNRNKTGQIVDKLADLSAKGAITSWNAFGMDTTAAGSVLADMIVAKIPGASAMLRCTFNGKASDKPVSLLDKTPGHEKHGNLMTELWLAPKDLMLSGQLGGIPEKIQQEMCGRRYGSTSGKDIHGRSLIEDKRTFKKRLGHSPDNSDCLFIACHVARVRLGLAANAKPAKIPKESKATSGFDFSRLEPKGNGANRRRLSRFTNLSWSES